MDSEKIIVSNEQGEQKEYDILFTFENNDKSYVLYYDASEEEPMVFASVYDDDGHLFDVETSEEWDLINDVFESFMGENADEDDEEHECCCGHHQHEDKDHECCGGRHHHKGENHECCGGSHHDKDHECCCKHHEEEE